MTDELRDYWTEGPGSESILSPGWLSRSLRWARRRRASLDVTFPPAPSPGDLVVIGDEVRLITETGYEVIKL